MSEIKVNREEYVYESGLDYADDIIREYEFWTRDDADDELTDEEEADFWDAVCERLNYRIVELRGE